MTKMTDEIDSTTADREDLLKQRKKLCEERETQLRLMGNLNKRIRRSQSKAALEDQNKALRSQVKDLKKSSRCGV